MNYELAKKLKDTGFPQTFDIGSRGHDGDAQYFSANIDTLDLMRKHCVYLPTLSELIEACGKQKKFCLIGVNGTHWLASVSQQQDEIKGGSGSNPEEAVANLWLALNEKKDV